MTEFFIVWTAVSDLSAVRVTVAGGLGSSLVAREELPGRGERGARLAPVSAGLLRPAGLVEVRAAISQEPTLGVTVTASLASLLCSLSTAATAGLRSPALG